MKKNLSYIIMLVAGAVIMAACSKDELPNDIPDAAGSEVLFTGAIKKQSEVLATTRANDIPDPDDYIILNGTNTEFGTFYIWMDVEGNSSHFQQYDIVSGVQGSLGVIVGEGEKEEDIRLNWQDKTSNHTFYAWTQPHVTGNEDETPTITGGVNMQIPDFGTKENSSEKPSGTVTFGTNGETNLEQFIITKKGPISYNTWGQDVALYFERPISKIVLDKVIHIDATGAIDKGIINCSIVFPNMYKKAKFDPFSFGDDSKSPLNGDDTNGKGIEWNWEKNNNKSNSLYVLPFKFGDDDDNSIQNDFGYFIVTLNDKNYAGSLNSLIIDESDTPKELKAGECLKLYLTINDGGGVGIGYQIIDWNTEDNEDIYEHRIPGVYNKEDADRLLKALTNQEGYKFPGDVQDLIVNTGNDTNPQHEINLFTHIDWSSVTTDINIPENYTLKGNGFNVTLKGNVKITGKVENIYIDGKKPEEPTPAPEP